MNVPLMKLPNLESLVTSSCFQHAVTALLKDHVSHVAQDRFILHHEDGLLSTENFRPGFGFGFGHSHRFAGSGEEDGESSSMSGFAGHIKPAAVLLNDAVHGCQTEAGSF